MNNILKIENRLKELIQDKLLKHPGLNSYIITLLSKLA
jgi:hypothetical protein